MKIRHETEQDYFATENCCRNAFWNLYKEGAEEHFVLHQMRKHKDFIPELSFVLEKDREIVGGIFYTRSRIVTDRGEIPAVTFGPVFIEPKFHRQGLGKMLISHSLEQAKKAGHSAVLTLGYPYHYEPYGFCGAKKYRISMPDGKFYYGLLALPLQKNALDNTAGYVQFSDVFDVNPNDAEQFDLKFPPKPKQILPCQKEYELACARLDEKKY